MLLCALLAAGCNPAARDSSALVAQRLPDLPDPQGFAGPYAGVSNGALIVAGGTNFPEAPPWEGGQKIWYDRMYVLESPRGPWQIAGALHRPLAHGVSISTEEGLICLGGGDADQNVADVFLLRWEGDQIHRQELPPLPRPMAGAAGAMLGRTIYIAGGFPEPDVLEEEAIHGFWALDLSAADPQWRELPVWPGPGRFFAVAAAHEDSFYLISGMRRRSDAAGQPPEGQALPAEGEALPAEGEALPPLEYLRDAYRYTPAADGSGAGAGAGGRWERLPDLPRSVAAAPTPAAVFGGRWIAVLGGGVSEEDVILPMDQREDLSPQVLAYDTRGDTWQVIGQVPASRVALPSAEWRGGVVVPTGEIQAGRRSPQVWSYSWEK